MRLLDLRERPLRLRSFEKLNLPKYLILSHTWSTNPEDEVMFKDIANGGNLFLDKPAWKKKVLGFCDMARRRGYDFIWIDTLCIDQSSSADVAYSINSMFKFYKSADECHVHLADVVKKSHMSFFDQPEMASGARPRWFTRGWTLQELLAPREVVFFDANWERLGTRSDLAPAIHHFTQIPITALHGKDPRLFSEQERFSWSRGRETTKPEDKVYSLLGLFGVSIVANYGEGQKHALERLKTEISLYQPDDASSVHAVSAYALRLSSIEYLPSGSRTTGRPSGARKPERDSESVISGASGYTMKLLDTKRTLSAPTGAIPMSKTFGSDSGDSPRSSEREVARPTIQRRQREENSRSHSDRDVVLYRPSLPAGEARHTSYSGASQGDGDRPQQRYATPPISNAYLRPGKYTPSSRQDGSPPQTIYAPPSPNPRQAELSTSRVYSPQIQNSYTFPPVNNSPPSRSDYLSKGPTVTGSGLRGGGGPTSDTNYARQPDSRRRDYQVRRDRSRTPESRHRNPESRDYGPDPSDQDSRDFGRRSLGPVVSRSDSERQHYGGLRNSRDVDYSSSYSDLPPGRHEHPTNLRDRDGRGRGEDPREPGRYSSVEVPLRPRIPIERRDERRPARLRDGTDRDDGHQRDSSRHSARRRRDSYLGREEAADARRRNYHYSPSPNPYDDEEDGARTSRDRYATRRDSGPQNSEYGDSRRRAGRRPESPYRDSSREDPDRSERRRRGSDKRYYS